MLILKRAALLPGYLSKRDAVPFPSRLPTEHELEAASSIRDLLTASIAASPKSCEHKIRDDGKQDEQE